MEGEPTEAKDKHAQIEGVPHHQGSSSLYQFGRNWACYNKTDKVPEGYDLYAMAHTASYKQVKGKARIGEEFNPSQIPYNPEQVMISSGGRSRGSIAIDPEIAPETTRYSTQASHDPSPATGLS